MLRNFKWFNLRNGYGFINRNDVREDSFVHQIARSPEENSRKIRWSVREGVTIEFDKVAGE